MTSTRSGSKIFAALMCAVFALAPNCPAQSDPTAAPAVNPLKNLAHSISEARRAGNRLQHAIKDLAAEFNRTDLKILEYGDFINQYIDGSPVPYQESLYPYGFQNIGNTGVTGGQPLPPRKKWVEVYVQHLDSLVDLTLVDMKAVCLAAQQCSKAQELDDLCAEMSATLADFKDNRDKIVAATKTDSYSAQTIKSLLASLSDEATHLDICAKKIARACHKK